MDDRVKIKSTYHKEHDLYLINIFGHVDLYQAPLLKDLLHAVVTTGRERLVVDLSCVEFIDSSGLGAIISAFAKLKKTGGMLKIAGAHGLVEKVFQITKMNTFFEMHTSTEEAIQSYRYQANVSILP